MTDRSLNSWRSSIGKVVVSLIIAVMLYIAMTIWSGLDQIRASLRIFPAGSYLPVIIGLVIFGWFLRALRWHYFVKYLAWQVPFSASILAFLASFALTATPGKAGEVVKAGLLRSRYDVAITDTAGVLLAERIGDLLAVLVLASGGVALLTKAWLYFSVCVIVVGAITIFVANKRLYRWFFSKFFRSPRFKATANKITELLDVGHSLMRPLPFSVGLSFALAAWVGEAWAFHFVLVGFGIKVTVLTAFSVYGISTVVGALSMLPGGIGGTEAAMLMLLKALGAKTALAVGATVLIRFSTLWLITVLGFFCFGIWLLTFGGNRSCFIEREK